MKLQHLYPVLAVCGISLTLWACGGAKSTLTPRTSATPTINTDTFAIHPVDIKSEVLTISDALHLFADGSQTATLAAKYGYHQKTNYEVNHLNLYSNMLYKACTLPQKMKNGSYTDLPRPMKKGTSSYVGVMKDQIEIGVFSTRTYEQLVDQVQQAGFKLAQDGYEQEYSNGLISVFCYSPGKRIRIVKTL